MCASAQQTDSQGNPVSMTVPHVQLINPENQIVEVSSSCLVTAALQQACIGLSSWHHVLIVWQMSPFYLLTVNLMCVLQPDGSMALDSDEGEEPSPEAMARYLSMRRHTVGVPDQR